MIFLTLNIFWEVFEQGLVKYRDKMDRFASSMQGLTLTMICCWGLVYVIFHNFWNKLFSLTTLQMVMMFLMIWTTAIFDFWAAEQRVKYQYKKLIVITLVISILSPLVGIFMVKISDDKVTARIVGLALVQFFCYIGLFFLQVKKCRHFYDKFFWKYALCLSIPLIPHYLSQTVLGSADRIMIKGMIGTSEAGIYSLAYSISLVMSIFNQSMNATLGPWIFQKIKDKRIGEISQITYMGFVLVAFVNILLIAFAPEIVHIFAPKEYYEAINLIPPIAMSVYFTFAYDIFCKFEFYFEKTKAIAMVTVIGAAVNMLLNYVFINVCGYRAAAYTTLACYIIYAVCHFGVMHRICKKEFSGNQPFSIRTLLFVTIIFLGIGFLFLISYNQVWMRWIIIMVIVLLVIMKRKKIIENLKTIISVRKMN